MGLYAQSQSALEHTERFQFILKSPRKASTIIAQRKLEASGGFSGTEILTMPIDVACSACDKSFRVKDELAGKKFKCSACGEVVVIPASRSTASPAKSASRKQTSAEAPGQRPPKKKASRPKSAGDATPPKKKKRPAAKKKRKAKPKPDAFDDDYRDAYADDMFGGADDFGDDYASDAYGNEDFGGDDYGDDLYNATPPRQKKSKPKAKKKKKKKSGGGLAIGFNINRLNIALIVIGGMLIFFGIQEARLAAQASSEPTPILLDELLANRPESVYLTVSDVVSSEGGYIAEENSSGSLTRIWAPCHPPGSPGANFILYTTEPDTENEADAFLSQTTFTGMIVNDIRSLGREERNMLQTIPGCNPDTAIIFEVGRTPSGAIMVILYFAGGLALILAGAAWIFLTGSD